MIHYAFYASAGILNARCGTDNAHLTVSLTSRCTITLCMLPQIQLCSRGVPWGPQQPLSVGRPAGHPPASRAG
eukprot:968583-Prorocentrum_minimum.AAC.1